MTWNFFAKRCWQPCINNLNYYFHAKVEFIDHIMSFFKPLFEHKEIEPKDIHQCPTLLDIFKSYVGELKKKNNSEILGKK